MGKAWSGPRESSTYREHHAKIRKFNEEFEMVSNGCGGEYAVPRKKPFVEVRSNGCGGEYVVNPKPSKERQ